jgi:hypothetical protein
MVIDDFGLMTTRVCYAAAILAVVFQGEASAQRRVEGTTIISDTLPAVKLAFDSSLTYVGNQTVMLSAVTHAEQHFFVESDAGRIKRLYWIQFEGKPSGSGRPYDYSRDPTIQFGGQTFHANFRYYPTSGFAGRAGSDGDQAQQLLEREGYRPGSDLARVRLVWLLDDPPFNELMIIYLEDLGDHGLSVAALREDPDRWNDFASGLKQRAVTGMRFLPGGN